jgi:hypothetical protein
MGVVNFRKRELRFDVEEFPVYQNPEFNLISHVTDSYIALCSDMHQKSLILKYDKENPSNVTPVAVLEERCRLCI